MIEHETRADAPTKENVLRQNTNATRATQYGERHTLQRTYLRLAVALLVYLGLAFGAYRYVDSKLKEQVRSQLVTSLASSITALGMWREWVELEQKTAMNLPALSERLALLQVGQEAPRSPAWERRMDKLLSAVHGSGYFVTDSQGKVVDASVPGLTGGYPPLPTEEYHAWKRQPTTRPWAPIAVEGLTDAPGYLVFSMPLDVSRSGPAALHLLIQSDGRFSEVMAFAQPGRTGETYAFDRAGRMISNSRFLDELKDLQLVPEDATDATLQVELRDPGRRLVGGEGPSDSPGDLPFTEMFLHALSDAPDSPRLNRGSIDPRDFLGSNIEGYRDYRGEEVVGAWYFNSGYGIGVAVELDAQEAYELRNTFRVLLLGLLGLLCGAVLLNVYSSYRNEILRRRSERAEAKALKLGQYTLKRKLGEGGMGAVYEAAHAMLRRPTAIKLIKADQEDGITRTRLKRFEREVQHTAELTHPNTISVYDYGRTADGTFYYAMEYLEGLDLEALVQQGGPLSVSRAVYLMVQACGSLQEAHLRGTVHRDIKPSNIMVCERGGEYDRVKVLDFGLVKSRSNDATQANVTQTSTITGTPMYMAPELIIGDDAATPASDIYALGAVLYFLLSGHELFEGRPSVMSVLTAQMTEPPRPLSELAPTVPAEVAQLVMDCLSKEPGGRPESMKALAQALSRGAAQLESWSSDQAEFWWQQHRSLLPQPPEQGGVSTTAQTMELQAGGATLSLDGARFDSTRDGES